MIARAVIRGVERRLLMAAVTDGMGEMAWRMDLEVLWSFEGFGVMGLTLGRMGIRNGKCVRTMEITSNNFEDEY